MKPYLTTGILFAAITVAHAYGTVMRGPVHPTDLDPVVSAGLGIWAWQFLRMARS